MWLMPVTYFIHAMEEYWCGEGFYRWAARVMGWEMTPTQFIVLNSTAWVFMVVSILALRKTPSIRWLTISFGTVAFINGFWHLVVSIWTGTYSPGTISGTLIWIPFGAATLYKAWRHATRRAIGSGVLVGIVIHVLIFLTLLIF